MICNKDNMILKNVDGVLQRFLASGSAIFVLDK